MANSSGAEVRIITDDEIVPWTQAVSQGFGSDITDPDQSRQRFQDCNVAEATLGAFDRGKVVGTFSTFDFDLTVPGGQLPMSGVTQVTVSPTHRRRGILTEMTAHHLDQATNRGQPVAGLWASEDRIYGRYGFGMATFGLDLSIDAGLVTAAPRPPDVSLHPVTADEAAAVAPAVYDRYRLGRPGVLSRSPQWWQHRHQADPDDWRRGGASARRWVVAERHGEVVGYVAYRQWEPPDTFGSGTTRVEQLFADDPGARRALWSFITNVDLFPNVTWWNAPLDEPILIEADRPRKVRWTRLDTLWVRLLDIPAALSARTYRHDGALTLHVADPFLGRGGTYHLEVENGRAHCLVGDKAGSAQLSLDVSDLGRLYLGGVTAIDLAAAGVIEGTPEVIRRADDLFRTDAPPWCPEMF